MPDKIIGQPSIHKCRVQIRASDPDFYGHVNHARALSLMEDARLAMFSAVPGVEPGEKPGIILRRIEVDYLRQLYYRPGVSAYVHSWVTAIGRTSLNVHQELVQDGALAIALDAILVHFDFTANGTRELTDKERNYWSAYLRATCGPNTAS